MVRHYETARIAGTASGKQCACEAPARIEKMYIFGAPAWLFAVVALGSLVMGVAIRKYLDNRKEREERELMEEAKRLKKQLKYEKKHKNRK
jgi:membrane protein implicated in regulation of membrane protease activity